MPPIVLAIVGIGMIEIETLMKINGLSILKLLREERLYYQQLNFKTKTNNNDVPCFHF